MTLANAALGSALALHSTERTPNDREFIMSQFRERIADKPSDRNIRAIARLEEGVLHSRSRADRLAWAITRAAGSGVSLLFHVLWFSVWLLANVGMFGATPFDPFPFTLLTMIVSIEVIFLSLVVLLNQNRMATETEKREHLNLQIGLLAERELTLILRMQRELSQHLGITGPLSRELEELLKDTDVDDIAAKLDRELPREGHP